MQHPVRVFISYSHESQAHAKVVLELANRLRQDGIDARVDLYDSPPKEGWIQWMESQVREAQYVLIICSPTFVRRFDGKEQPPKGRGLRWEGMLARILMWDETADAQVVPVLIQNHEDEDAAVPFVLRGAPRFHYPQAYEELYRLLSDQPLQPLPPLGEPVHLPRREPASAGIPDRSYPIARPIKRSTLQWVVASSLVFVILAGGGTALSGVMVRRLLSSVVLVHTDPTNMPSTLHLLGQGAQAQAAHKLLPSRVFFAPSDEEDVEQRLYLWVTRQDASGRTWARPAIAKRSGTEYELQPVQWDTDTKHFIAVPDQPHVGRGDENPQVPVGVMLPGNIERCEDPAGKALHDGMEAFKNGRRRIDAQLEPDEGDVAKAREAAAALLKRNPVAVVGSYHTRCTAELLRACQVREGHDALPLPPWSRSRCGPIVTLSAASALRPPTVSVPWMFRVTMPNQDRAAALLRIVEEELHDERDLLHIVYMDDSRPGSLVDYTLDQARQLYAQLHAEQSASPRFRVRWTRFRGRRGDGPRFYAASPFEAGEPLNLTVNELIRTIANDGVGRKVWVLIAWDADIVQFGKAFQALQEEHSSQMQWYVPGPREVFEYDLAMCHEEGYMDMLEGAHVLSPDDRHSSEAAYRFVSAWRSDAKRARSLAPMRAARIYDALQLVEIAARRVDRQARQAGIDLVHVDLYRLWLRDTIASMSLLGAAGFISFNSEGDMQTPTFLMDIHDGELRPLPAIGIAAQRRPAPPEQARRR